MTSAVHDHDVMIFLEAPICRCRDLFGHEPEVDPLRGGGDGGQHRAWTAFARSVPNRQLHRRHYRSPHCPRHSAILASAPITVLLIADTAGPLVAFYVGVIGIVLSAAAMLGVKKDTVIQVGQSWQRDPARRIVT
ncbi:hypothetical protein MI170_31845 [Mycolicibacterium goodii]|uniref:hypothetical protein n=1 Tax=Mycolicibacterium goodii TaxID=134601 RepID=UPI001F0359CC|nr:hypothetical protein [Mycolicibacterium goodii]ULN47768.1 hypothetical protein MI170_31845 [Mycolicibacterium goodii]